MSQWYKFNRSRSIVKLVYCLPKRSCHIGTNVFAIILRLRWRRVLRATSHRWESCLTSNKLASGQLNAIME